MPSRTQRWDAYHKKEEKSASQQDLAKAFITGLLAGGDVASDDVYAKGADAGFPAITLKRAKSKLPVKSEKRGKEWFWIWEQAQGYQSAQQRDAAPDSAHGAGYANGKLAAETLDTLDTLALEDAS